MLETKGHFLIMNSSAQNYKRVNKHDVSSLGGKGAEFFMAQSKVRPMHPFFASFLAPSLKVLCSFLT